MAFGLANRRRNAAMREMDIEARRAKMSVLTWRPKAIRPLYPDVLARRTRSG